MMWSPEGSRVLQATGGDAVRQTFSGHYEIRSRKERGDWYHLQVYEALDAPPVVIASMCSRGTYESLHSAATGLATRVFWHLIPYARDDFQWFERRESPASDAVGTRERFYQVTFSLWDSSGGPQLTKPRRTATTKARIKALIEEPLTSVSCPALEGEGPAGADDPQDDPWYLPPDTPIPVSFHLDGGRSVHAISKMERSRRLRLLEERALMRRDRLLGY